MRGSVLIIGGLASRGLCCLCIAFSGLTTALTVSMLTDFLLLGRSVIRCSQLDCHVVGMTERWCVVPSGRTFNCDCLPVLPFG